jgi:hypothetical protein
VCVVFFICWIKLYRSLPPLIPVLLMRVYVTVYVFVCEESSLNYTCDTVFSLFSVEKIDLLIICNTKTFVSSFLLPLCLLGDLNA